jgi:hypothetical protein
MVCETKETRGFFAKPPSQGGVDQFDSGRSNLGRRLQIRRLRCCASAGGGDWPAASSGARRCAVAQGGFGGGVHHSPRGKHRDTAKLTTNT